jgi:hypothetical protein
MATAKKTTKKKSTTSKKDLEAKIADLEAKLNKLAAAQDAKPAEAAPKPAETKPAETAKPKPAETAKPKPAETAKPKPAETAPKPAEKAPPVPLHERFREIPTGNWNTQKVAITGFTAPSNRYFGSRALAAQVEVTPSNWNDHKTKITGYTAPGNKYFATKQRLAYHPEAKKFGTWIKDTPAPQTQKPAEAKKAEAGGPHGHDEKPKVEAKPKKADNADTAKDAYAAEMKKKGATLPKGFIKDAKANTGH